MKKGKKDLRMDDAPEVIHVAITSVKTLDGVVTSIKSNAPAVLTAALMGALAAQMLKAESGKKPGRKPGKKPGRKPGKKPGKRGPGRPRKAKVQGSATEAK